MNLTTRIAAVTAVLLGLSLTATAKDRETGTPAPAPLDGWMTNPALWTDGAQAFMDEAGSIGFEYESGRDVAQSTYPGLSFLSNRVWEAKAFFATGRVTRIELLMFSRGDSGDMAEDGFNRLTTEIAEYLSRWAGSKGVSLPDRTRQAMHHVEGRAWVKPPCRVEMECAHTTVAHTRGEGEAFRAEYVRLRIMPTGTYGNAPSALTAGRSAMPSGMALKKRVRHADNGDAWIGDIPMVDQGEKGYCAAATAERVLRYFGRPIDQHQVAQLANTARDKGTSHEGMLDALRTIGHPYQLELRPLQEFDWAEVVNLLRAYNRTASTKHKPEIQFGQTITLSEVYEEMDPGVLRQARARDTQGIGRFRQQIAQYTTAGVPLVWGVMVGLYPETPPLRVRGAFGHVRLIIGMNTKTDEILYSDTWGPGHECKRMPMSDAWAMTVSMHVIKPRDVR